MLLGTGSQGYTVLPALAVQRAGVCGFRYGQAVFILVTLMLVHIRHKLVILSALVNEEGRNE